MSAGATSQERVNIAHSIIDSFEERDFDAREITSTLICALVITWKRHKMIVELFDGMMAAARREILSETFNDVKPS